MIDETLRRKILAILDGHRNMTIATLRPDGWPQATTVGYANDGLTLRIFKVTPAVISLLDCTRGFAHTDLVTC